MFEYITPAEKTAGLVNTVISILLTPSVGLLITLIMFVVGMVRGGDYGFAKACFIGFLIGFLFWVVIGVVFGVTFWDDIVQWADEHLKETEGVLLG